MTTPTTALIDNKTALRASLKKEDESLASRLTDNSGGQPVDRVAAPVASDPSPSTKASTRTNSDMGTGQAPVGKAAKKVGKKTDMKVVRAQPRKPDKPVERKPEKMVRCAVDLPKSEDTAIDTLRSDLAKTTGWKASKSEIVRAAVQLFAEQKPGAKKELLAAVSPPARERKKG